MTKKIRLLWVFCLAVLLNGCAMRTVEQMYSLPKRSLAYSNLQSAIDKAMVGLSFAAPNAGENQQTVQQADLNGDGKEEYLLFAQGETEKNLQILIFSQSNNEYDLIATIDNPGFSFEQVEYVQIDGKPGLEIVVGCRVSEQVQRSLTVYTFAHGEPEQMMAENYSKFLTCDFQNNGSSELVLLRPGETEADNGVAVLYQFRKGQMERSREVDLSESVDNVKRIMVSSLESGEPAVYVASSIDESAIITDVFALKNLRFTNVSFSNESGTSVQTLRNYYVYADDIDGDGILELPNLITMTPLPNELPAGQHYLIRWYAMNLYGAETDKRYTYHNFSGGWYLELSDEISDRISVRQQGSEHIFYLWNEDFTETETLLRIYVLTGPNREDQALEEGRFVLHRGDGVLYAAKLETNSVSQNDIIDRFHLIHHDWKTGET